MLSKTKKGLILAGMVLLLVVTGYLNVVLSAAADNVGGNLDDNIQMSFFDGFRSEREAGRAQSILILDSILASADSSEQAKANAEAEKLKIAQTIQTELALESLIKALNFEDVVVTTTTENINVIVQDDDLTAAEVAQILDIIVSETGASPINVRVTPI